MGSICERTEVNNAIIEIHHDKIKQKEIGRLLLLPFKTTK